jgi:hypothetical protein
MFQMATKMIEFYWQPYAHASEVTSLQLKLAGSYVATVSLLPTDTTYRVALDLALGSVQAALSAFKANGEESEVAMTTIPGEDVPPPPTKLPAPVGFGWRVVDETTPPPPPPPTGDSAFFQNVVLHDVGGHRLLPGQSKNFGTDPRFNVHNKSWGLSFKYKAETAPGLWATVSLWNGGNPQWMLKSTGETRIAATFGKSNASYDGFDIPGVDSVVGRFVHVVIGYDATTKMARIWIDGVLKQEKALDAHIGWSDTAPPDFIVNSTEAGHEPGDMTTGELVYAVGATPTQADVDKLYGEVAHEPGFFVLDDGNVVKVEAYGVGYADLNHEHPKAWIDGAVVELTKVRDNRPRELRYEGSIPAHVGSGAAPIRAEWRWNGKRAPDAVREAMTVLNRPYTPKEPAIPAVVPGMAHIRRDGSMGFDLREDSEIYVGVYGFSAAEFGDNRYGLATRDEMLAANFGVEGGSILHYDPAQAANFDEWWVKTGDFRRINALAFERWSGPWSVPDDDLFWNIGVNLKAWMELPTFEADVKRWCDWRNNFPGSQKPRFVITKDEATDAFGGDPASTTHPNLKDIAPLGGMLRVTNALRQGGQPIAPGLFGVDDTVPVGYTDWTKPEYSDFIVQYYQPNLLPAPWTGQTLRHQAIQMKWAAKHRDPNRPLSLNFGIIVDYFVRDEQGQWYKQIPANSPKTIPGQLWVCLAYGSTVLRGYAMATYDARQPSDDPAAWEYQQGVKPGEPAYYAMLSSATMIKDYTKFILGAEQPLMDAGPDFVCGHRSGATGRIWWAVNLSEEARTVPAAAIPGFDWAKVETMDVNGKRTDATTATPVPGNGVMVMVAPNAA